MKFQFKTTLVAPTNTRKELSKVWSHDKTSYRCNIVSIKSKISSKLMDIGIHQPKTHKKTRS